jgi:hypothetical protein
LHNKQHFMEGMKTIKLKDILSISGKGGLFRFVAQARNGIVVESLEDQKRHVAPSTARVSSLEDIAIFTSGEEVPLADIFYMIQQKTDGKAAISHKAAPEELKKEFETLVPDYDQDKVYVSDIRKVFHWYNQLQGHNLLEVVDKEEKSATEEKSGKKENSSKEEDSAPKIGEGEEAT